MTSPEGDLEAIWWAWTCKNINEDDKPEAVFIIMCSAMMFPWMLSIASVVILLLLKLVM